MKRQIKSTTTVVATQTTESLSEKAQRLALDYEKRRYPGNTFGEHLAYFLFDETENQSYDYYLLVTHLIKAFALPEINEVFKAEFGQSNFGSLIEMMYKFQNFLDEMHTDQFRVMTERLNIQHYGYNYYPDERIEEVVSGLEKKIRVMEIEAA